jgi:hypothetical protein
LLEKKQTIGIKLFELEAYKAGITILSKDIDLIGKKFADPSKPHKILYEDAIKSLVPVIGDNTAMYEYFSVHVLFYRKWSL